MEIINDIPQIVNIGIQINGKTIGAIETIIDTLQEEIMNKAKQKFNIQYKLPNLAKIVFVPNKLMNFVGR